ncbi:hypothetical protein HY345_02240 [Candidatus Microgenomates bacterium]|nr:hypothetical protein [Candidatus Microgenomates bacterium]
METIVSDKISVVAIYDQKKNTFSPRKIKWQERVYEIKKIAFHHQVREGTDLFHIFSATTETVDFLLKFNAQNLIWTLEKISDGNAS